MDPERIRELFSRFGAVAVRRMFGGAGLYADGIMFGLVSDGEIYLKSDTETEGRFEAEGCGPFEYATKRGQRAVVSFRKLPERLYDDADELAVWAQAALAAARRRATSKHKPAPGAPVKRRSARKKR